MTSMLPSAAPMPMPALAPVDNVDDSSGCCWVVVCGVADDVILGTYMDEIEVKSVAFQRSSIPYAFQPSFLAVAVA